MLTIEFNTINFNKYTDKVTKSNSKYIYIGYLRH